MFFHGVASIVLTVGPGQLLHTAAGHATPWGAPQSIAEAKRWTSIMTRPNRGMPPELADRVLPGVLGTDSNSITGDRVQRPDGTWGGYHANDPFEGHPWIPDMTYHAAYLYEFDEATGLPIPRCDRTAGDILWAGGLHDPSALLTLPFSPTTGYHAIDPFMPRDVDHLRITADLRDAVIGVTVLDNKRVRAVSDHRPRQLRLRRSRIPATLAG